MWEAVTQYLTEQGVRATFDRLAKAARGSRLAFTYVRKGFLTGGRPSTVGIVATIGLLQPKFGCSAWSLRIVLFFSGDMAGGSLRILAMTSRGRDTFG